jgi:hypothetical protein
MKRLGLAAITAIVLTFLIAPATFGFTKERDRREAAFCRALRFPTFEFDKEQSAASRAKVEAFVQRTGTRWWIEHDLATFTMLKKAPAFYE